MSSLPLSALSWVLPFPPSLFIPLSSPLHFSTSEFFFFYFLNFDFFSQSFMRLMTLFNLYTFLKPKTLTFELSLSLSPLCLGSYCFPFLSLYLKPLPYKPSPFTHSLLLCLLFADFSVFSGNLYDFTLDLKFSAFFH